MFYIKKRNSYFTKYWTGKDWSNDVWYAKGYKFEKVALNSARKIIKRVLAEAKEITIETTK